MRDAPVFALGILAAAPLLAGFPALNSNALPLLGESRPQMPALRGLVSSVLTLREKGSLMLRIPAGPVLLGSTPTDVLEAAASCAAEPLGGRCNEHTFENELEQRRSVVASFWIDRTEVSVSDYARCVAAGACQPPEFTGAERFNHPEYPVSFVSFRDARAYCRFRGARLPHEAEFERAARGSAGRRYPWGTLYNAHVLNHGRLGVFENEASDGYAELAPVGSFPDGRTPEGVLDLAGNVAEWQADPYRERSSEELPADDESAGRVARGGSFLRGASFVRGAARERLAPQERRPDVGLRCARSAQGFGS